MAQIKINSGNIKNNKLKMNSNGQKKSPSNTVQFNLGNKEESSKQIDDQQISQQPINTGMPEPITTPLDSFSDESQSMTEDCSLDDKDDLINDEEDDDLGTRKGRKKAKNKKKGKTKNNKNNKKKDNSPQTVEARYKAYTIRKYVTIGCLVLITLALIFFGVFNTFFKHTLTEVEAASYTNKLNGQTQVQKWDTGVQGYLQSNLQTILSSNASLSNSKEFTVGNISVEQNLQVSSDSLISFFSADIEVAGQTNRVFFELPLKIVDNKFTQAGALSMTFREPYASDNSTISENEFLDFGEIKIDEEESKAFENVLENFLTLGYNEKQDISNFYKGESPLDFNGKFTGIVKCEVYEESNQLGYNTIAVYNIELPNGFKYKTTNLMKIEKQGSSYIITKIL